MEPLCRNVVAFIYAIWETVLMIIE